MDDDPKKTLSFKQKNTSAVVIRDTRLNDNSSSSFQKENHDTSTSLPESIDSGLRMGYRSVGLGLFGATMRFIGMPLEKMALFMNSAQVSSGKGSLAQAVNLTFEKGIFTPYRVVSPTSGVAWFLQYSVMGMVFQSVDKSLSHFMDVPLMPYGSELMKDPRHDIISSTTSQQNVNESSTLSSSLKMGSKIILAPILSGTIESVVANRAEVQRYYGIHKLSQLESQLQHNFIRRICGPAFIANSSRNAIMSCTSFVITPILYRNYFPQESKNKSSLFWFGLGVNIGIGNVIAITQQSLWGRALDYSVSHEKARNIHYSSVIRQGLNSDGYAAFFTFPKFFSRVLMNAPVQGTLPWFYNEILPVFEPGFIGLCTNVYKKTWKSRNDKNHHDVCHESTIWLDEPSSSSNNNSVERDNDDNDDRTSNQRMYYSHHINHDVNSSSSSSAGPSMVQATSGYTNCEG
jgi:hypothetical protein